MQFKYIKLQTVSTQPQKQSVFVRCNATYGLCYVDEFKIHLPLENFFLLAGQISGRILLKTSAA
jgi:hypothetical protein